MFKLIKRNNLNILGHILALITAIIWGVTLISTKILLREFQPVEILLYRFLIALLMFYIICPKNEKKLTKKQEMAIALAGFFGITLYYFFENVALVYTLASNVGLINCMAPLFTAILTILFFKNREKIKAPFFVGFVFSIIGISLISFNGVKININPLGDILALFAAISWGFYSVLIKKIGTWGISTLIITKKAFLYGIIFMVPFLCLFNFKFGFERFLNPVNLLNILFLGLCASGLCFLAWNKAIKLLGAVKCNVYLYLIPVITLIMSALILKEPISLLLMTGAVLTISGLIISEMKK